MSYTNAPYLVERQTASETDWSPVTYCRSLQYARRVALLGLRENAGISYRARNLRTGNAIELALPRPPAKAGRTAIGS